MSHDLFCQVQSYQFPVNTHIIKKPANIALSRPDFVISHSLPFTAVLEYCFSFPICFTQSGGRMFQSSAPTT